MVEYESPEEKFTLENCPSFFRCCRLGSLEGFRVSNSQWTRITPTSPGAPLAHGKRHQAGKLSSAYALQLGRLDQKPPLFSLQVEQGMAPPSISLPLPHFRKEEKKKESKLAFGGQGQAGWCVNKSKGQEKKKKKTEEEKRKESHSTVPVETTSTANSRTSGI
ncbi:hypothetical protein ABW19_dt0205508 [Dactylella cylindrospora]|nr:hypothetical protein ABW19_dt0205508 [Dactylella cylindrospora]